MFKHPPGLRANSTVPDAKDLGRNISIWGMWGPGESWCCENLYNEAIGESSEFNKAGSNTASTIMALLPPLISFAPVSTTNIGFLCYLSTTQGFIAAVFTFGLPVHQLDTWRWATIRVKDLLANPQLGDNDVVTIRLFSKIADILLAPIKNMALHPRRPRRILVLALRFIFAYTQAILILLVLSYVPRIDSFYLIWLCPDWGKVVFGLWLGITFILMGWWRAKYERDSFEGEEVIYISEANATLGTGSYWRRLQNPYPMIVILHPSNDARERQRYQANLPWIHYLIGMLQLLWICFLSFLFSSTFGGTLFRTLLMVVTFITVVGLSRGVSILACWAAQKYLHLKIIEYDDLGEKMMMQRFLGGLPGALIDIQWVNYKKSQWQKSVKMYQWGHQLSHGNVTAVPDNSGQCPRHLKIQHRDAVIDDLLRIAFVTFFVSMTIITPTLIGWDDSGISAVRVGAAIVITAASTVSCWHLGRTKKLLICNCG